jgi:hypothetical protein
VVNWLETPDAEATEPETQEPGKPRND